MSLAGKHILSSDQFGRPTLERLFEIADLLRPVARGEQVTRVLEGAVMGSLFFEASTRTRLSCDSAFMRLGGSVSHSTGFAITSISKGESLADTSRVVSGIGVDGLIAESLRPATWYRPDYIGPDDAPFYRNHGA